LYFVIKIGKCKLPSIAHILPAIASTKVQRTWKITFSWNMAILTNTAVRFEASSYLRAKTLKSICIFIPERSLISVRNVGCDSVSAAKCEHINVYIRLWPASFKQWVLPAILKKPVPKMLITQTKLQ
jgi:hypothetical protein